MGRTKSRRHRFIYIMDFKRVTFFCTFAASKNTDYIWASFLSFLKKKNKN